MAVLIEATGLISLRVYGSVHLATARYLSKRLGGGVSFACFDRALNRAASTLGMRVRVPAS